MLILIVLSIVPLTVRQEYIWMKITDKVIVSIFIIDYLLRWFTADFTLPKKEKWKAFLIYPFTPLAVLDLLSILPSISACSSLLKLLRISRMVKLLRVFRFIRYSKNFNILLNVLRKEKNVLLAVLVIALFYILLTALIMFNAEDVSMFDNFFDAIYWATTTLTTVGYGDIYPHSELGRAISMISSLVGVAVIALPSGIITAGYLEELRKK